ncbi:MAG TPA: formate dehydrogenase, partial [Paracoccaceae bacterium]|nr:formate dehydrogenase [Paracoccaceae bacterium]
MLIKISDDALARALGADDLARAFAAKGHEVHRVSSWGMQWLEPLVDVGGTGFGPATLSDVDAILDGSSAKSIGVIADHPFITGQQRLTFARAGKTRPTNLDDYQATGGFAGLARARAIGPEAIVAEVLASGLRGRGGAGFPAGIKWKTVAAAPGSQKYIVCNADEGDSATFADRMVMEGDPFQLIEGMTIAGEAVGASQGYIYVRSEYPDAIAKLNAALAQCTHLIAPFQCE